MGARKSAPGDMAFDEPQQSDAGAVFRRLPGQGDVADPRASDGGSEAETVANEEMRVLLSPSGQHLALRRGR